MRRMTPILTAAAVFMTAAGALSAQNVLRRSSMDSVLMKRAALGIQLQLTGTARDTIGVFVSRVSPKGPAETAGIVEGDRVVSINGTDLRVSAADAGDSYAGELPSRRLTRTVEKLAPGNVVTLRVSSSGRVHDVQVTAGRASDLREGSFGMMMGMNGMGGMDGMLRSMPRMNPEDMKRMREDMQRMKQDMPMVRERMQELPMRLREMEMAPMRMRLRDSGSYKTFGPSGSVYIYRDSAGRKSWTYDSKTKAEKAAAEKAAVEKAKKEKEKNKN